MIPGSFDSLWTWKSAKVRLTRNGAAVSFPATTGTIGYVVPNDTTSDQIRLHEPDGGNKRKIYSTG